MATGLLQSDGYEWSLGSDLVNWTWQNESGQAADSTEFFADAIMIGYSASTSYRGVFRIGPLAVAQGQTITSASIAVTFARTRKDSDITIKGVADSVTFGVPGTSNLTHDATLTTASVQFFTSALDAVNYDPFDNWTPDPALQSFDILTILQEIVNNANWVSGGYAVITMDGVTASPYNNHMRVYSDEFNSTSTQITYEVDTTAAIVGLSTGSTILNQSQTVTVTTANLDNEGTLNSVVISKGAQSRAQTISGTATDTAFAFVWSQGNLGYGSGYTLTATYSGGLVLTTTIALDSVEEYVTITDISSLTDISLGFNAEPPIAVGDVFEYFGATGQGDVVTINGRGEPTLTGTGTGLDSFNARYWPINGGVWSDVEFSVDFLDNSYIGQNIIPSLVSNTVLQSFLQVISNAEEIPAMESHSTISELTTETELVESPNTGFASVNKPTLRIIDASNTVILYAGRDNTAEFQFLESGVAVDLQKATKIDLIIGSDIYSDTDFQYAEKFTKWANGILEVQLGELGLAGGYDYNFYFVIYTPGQPNGVVWNDVNSYKVTMKNA